MKKHFNKPVCSAHAAGAFSLLEMMLVMALLSLIVYVLYSVFDHTQRALRANTTQVDIMESGRATLDMLSRDLESMEKSGLTDPTWPTEPSFYAGLLKAKWPMIPLEKTCPNLLIRQAYDWNNELTQPLVDGTRWTNVLQDCIFLTRSNNIWTVNAYFVVSQTNLLLTTNTVNEIRAGTLFRVTAVKTNVMARYQLRPEDMEDILRQLTLIKQQRTYGTNLSLAMLADGIVHFRLRPLDRNGRAITNAMPNGVLDDGIYIDRVMSPKNVLADRLCLFSINSLPAHVDLELGIIDPSVLQKMRAIPAATAQRQYLERQAGAVQLFHKLIPVRSVQQYPQP